MAFFNFLCIRAILQRLALSRVTNLFDSKLDTSNFENIPLNNLIVLHQTQSRHTIEWLFIMILRVVAEKVAKINYTYDFLILVF